MIWRSADGLSTGHHILVLDWICWHRPACHDLWYFSELLHNNAFFFFSTRVQVCGAILLDKTCPLWRLSALLISVSPDFKPYMLILLWLQAVWEVQFTKWKQVLKTDRASGLRLLPQNVVFSDFFLVCTRGCLWKGFEDVVTREVLHGCL